MTQTVTDLVTLPNVSTFNSNTNRIKVRIDYLSCASKSDDVVQLYILNGATSTGGIFTEGSTGVRYPLRVAALYEVSPIAAYDTEPTSFSQPAKVLLPEATALIDHFSPT